MAWFLWVLKFGPDIISIIVAIVKVIKEIENPVEKAVAELQFKTAMKDIKAKGDFSNLERMKDRCGLRCRIEERFAKR